MNKFSGLRRLKLDKHPQIREPEKYYQMTAAMLLISADTKLLFTPLIMRVVGGNVTTHHMVTRGDETLGLSKLSEVIKYDNRRKFTIKHLNHHLVVKFMNSSPFREYRGAKEAESNKAQIHRAFQSSLRTQPADRANLVSNSVPISCINQVKYYFRGKYNTESKLLARAHTFLKGQAVPSWVLSTLETEALMMVYRSRILGSMIVGTDITGSDGPTGIDPMAAGTVDIDEDAEHDPHSNPSWVGTRDQILGHVGTMNTVQDHEVDFDFMYNKTTGRLKKRYKEQVGQDEDEECRQDVVVRVSNFNDQDIYINLDKAFLESNLISFLVKREGRTVYPKGKTRGRLWDILENKTEYTSWTEGCMLVLARMAIADLTSLRKDLEQLKTSYMAERVAIEDMVLPPTSLVVQDDLPGAVENGFDPYAASSWLDMLIRSDLVGGYETILSDASQIHDSNPIGYSLALMVQSVNEVQFASVPEFLEHAWTAVEVYTDGEFSSLVPHYVNWWFLNIYMPARQVESGDLSRMNEASSSNI